MKINHDKFCAAYSLEDSSATAEEIESSYLFYSEMLPLFVSIYEQGKAGKPLEDLLFWVEVANEH